MSGTTEIGLMGVEAGPFSGTKVLSHLDRLHSLLAGGTPPPTTVEIDLTNACNLKCPHCSSADLRSLTALDEGVLMQTLQSAALLGVKAITFTGGGEPTTSALLVPAIEYTLSLGMEAALFTNGVARPGPSLLRLLPNLSWVRISLDAYDAGSYSRVHGVPGLVFERVLSNIRRYVENKGKCTIGLGYLTGSPEQDQGIVAAAELASSLSADYLQFRPTVYPPQDARCDSGASKPLSVAFAVEEAERVAGSCRILAAPVRYGFPAFGTICADYPARLCWGVHFSCVVGATGDVYACCHLRGTRHTLGNVYRRTLDEIWRDRDNRERVYLDIDPQKDCVAMCKFRHLNQVVQAIADAQASCEHRNFL